MKLFISVIIIHFSQKNYAQDQRRFTVQYPDTLVLSASDRFLTSNIHFTNIHQKAFPISIQFKSADGWRCVTVKDYIDLQPTAPEAISLTVVPLAGALATWQPLKMLVTDIQTKRVDSFTILVKTSPNKKFITRMLKQDLKLTKADKKIDISIYIKNAGNIENIYTIDARNTYFEFRYLKQISLPPATDTVYQIPFKIPAGKWANLQQENINITVFDSLIASQNHAMIVHKVADDIKLHPSAYATMPLDIGFGYFYFNNRSVYYGNAKGSINLSKNDKIGFYFRSKQIGAANQLQRNIFGISYTGKNWTLNGGSVNNVSYFPLDRYGGSIAYRFGKFKEVKLSAALHNKFSIYKNDNIEALFKWGTKKITAEHTVMANTDRVMDTRSYLMMNKLTLMNTQKANLKITAGTGINKYPLHLRSYFKEKIGLTGGYNFDFREKNYYFSSLVDYYSKDFPGLYNGSFSQNHKAKYTGKKGGAGLFYQENKINNNFFVDTVFNSGVFNFNTTRYGINGELYKNTSIFMLNLGIFNQKGTTGNSLPKYNFFDFSYLYSKGKNFRFRLNTFNGIGRLNRQDKNSKQLWLNNSSASISYGNIGVSGFFISNPVIITDSVKQTFINNSQTYNISAFAGTLVFKKLFINISYNYSRSLYDSIGTSSLNPKINYNNYTKGINFSFYGSIPITKSNAPLLGSNTNYFNISLQKSFNIPIITKKKYHNLKVVAFNDINNNGQKDADEPGLKKVPIKINDNLLITNEKGIALCQNGAAGKYVINLKNITNVKGLVPAFGDEQEIELEKSVSYSIPFKKSRVISGQIIVKLDSFNTTQFTPNGIKVMVMDSLGKMTQVLTDEKGKFFFNLPANYYTVSLNSQAFNDNLKPVVISYKADLINKEEEVINFTIVEKNRKVRFLKKSE